MKDVRLALRRRLFDVAVTQAGYFTAAQACDIGYSYQAQHYHVKRGNWLKVDRGLFRLAESVPGTHDDLALWSLWAGHQAVISHESALEVHNVGEFNPKRVHLTTSKKLTKEASGVVTHQAEFLGSEVQDHGSFRVTSATRSLVDVAGNMAEADQLQRAIEDARELGLITIVQLREAAERIDLKAALQIERALAGLGV